MFWVLNIEQNKCSNVELLNIALSDVADQSVFFGELEEDQKTNFGDIRINKEAEGTEVKTTTIDSLNIQDRVSFIKVDCQGYDLKVMRGAKETIEKHRPVVVFEWEDDMSSDFNDTIEDVLAFYSELNYKVNKIEKDDWIAIPNEVS